MDMVRFTLLRSETPIHCVRKYPADSKKLASIRMSSCQKFSTAHPRSRNADTTLPPPWLVTKMALSFVSAACSIMLMSAMFTTLTTSSPYFALAIITSCSNQWTLSGRLVPMGREKVMYPLGGNVEQPSRPKWRNKKSRKRRNCGPRPIEQSLSQLKWPSRPVPARTLGNKMWSVPGRGGKLFFSLSACCCFCSSSTPTLTSLPLSSHGWAGWPRHVPMVSGPRHQFPVRKMSPLQDERMPKRSGKSFLYVLTHLTHFRWFHGEHRHCGSGPP
mmetsp:Transcript_12625/g.27331  ORF Transcript_12625/g.27331 Transcript_12625/m.27331 type:complete len:273 (-) Transcript_12625:608-1426(-)